MARNLHRAGLLARVWNRTTSVSTELARELGIGVGANPADLASSCDVIVLCVSADTDVLEVVDAMLPGLRPGTVVVDCSTVSAETAKEAARRLAAKNVEFLDAPVSGGVEGARDGTLAIMVGGTEAAFARVRPVLAAMGRTVTRFGPTGAGQAAKATNQIMCAGIIQAVAEAMAFAKAEGLPLDKLIDTLGQGAGSSWYFVHRAPNMARGSYPPGFRLRLHEKDLRICREMAARHGVELPVIESTLRQYRRLVEEGHGDEDISTIFRLKDALFTSGAPAEGLPASEPAE
jgi:3-hydroxyisobutyrate dehydrogenase